MSCLSSALPPCIRSYGLHGSLQGLVAAPLWSLQPQTSDRSGRIRLYLCYDCCYFNQCELLAADAPLKITHQSWELPIRGAQPAPSRYVRRCLALHLQVSSLVPEGSRKRKSCPASYNSPGNTRCREMFPSASVLLSDEVANLPSSGDPTAVPYKLYSLLFDPSLSFPPPQLS